MDLEQKLKTALDESRLLILGAQVLFGFTFQVVFQDLFSEVPPVSQALQCTGLAFMLVSVCLLIAPSLYHQIVFEGESRPGALAYASWFAGASLLPLTLGLGASVFVVFEQLFGRTAGAVFGLTFATGSLLLLYGLGFALRRRLHVYAVVQGTPAVDPVSSRCGSLRRRSVCIAADDAGGPPSDRLPWGG